MLMVSATAVITTAGLWREVQLEALDGIDVTGNPELAAAVLNARTASTSSWMNVMAIVLAVATVVVVSRWLHTLDRTLYDAGVCAPDRRHRQPSRLQYFGALAALATLAAVFVGVLPP